MPGISIDPSKWLLKPSADGKPWGTGTKMAERAKTGNPWDTNCKVTPLIGGYKAMNAMAAALESLISDATTSPTSQLPLGQRGHVYIAGFRFSCQRDLSHRNVWQTGPWSSANKQLANEHDETFLGFVLRLMQAGVAVRILAWLPTFVEKKAAHLQAHIEDHEYLSQVVCAENIRLGKPAVPLGIVGLDARTADGAVAGAHHQKMMVIRSPNPDLNVAFCGGVDLTFTRRDAPSSAHLANYDPAKDAFLDGDWQSGTMPPLKPAFPPGITWPPEAQLTKYASAGNVKPPTVVLPSDLPWSTDVEDVCDAMSGKWGGTTCAYTDGKGAQGTPKWIYGSGLHIWHDQHLKLEGPIVATLEWQFAERWIDWARPPRIDLFDMVDWKRGEVFFRVPEAFLSGIGPIAPLEAPKDVVKALPDATSIVQMWRTVPMRDRKTSLFQDGEFTVMAGYSNAINAATELIWIFDQYFWSEALARLLNYRVSHSNVCVLLILPPYADATYGEEHLARAFALAELTRDLDADQLKRVAVYNLWHPGQGRGIYVHAKAQTYDGSLLVCGSANMNRRSLTCDSELSCAVVDTTVVATHQANLWQLLFGKVTDPAGAWPGLDLNLKDNGKNFLDKFKAAAAAPGAFVVPDPWDDNNPNKGAQAKMVALPNAVPRPTAFPGPKFEVMIAGALDPGSLDRSVEQDVVDGSSPPRPVRLDEIVKRIESKCWRKQANPASSVITSPTNLYPDDRGYFYTENAEWWKQMCLGFPCFVPMNWPDYDTTFIDQVKNATSSIPLVIDGQAVVLQLWKGWCQKFLGDKRMPGGIGAEIGVYRRIPNRLPPMNLPPEIPRPLRDVLLQGWKTINDANRFWWPYPELDTTIQFTLTNPRTNESVFSGLPQKTWWYCKWMIPDSYTRYQAEHNEALALPVVSDYILQYEIMGKTSSYSGTW